LSDRSAQIISLQEFSGLVLRALCRASKAWRTRRHSCSASHWRIRNSGEIALLGGSALAIGIARISSGSQVRTHATNWFSVQFFFFMTWKSKRWAMMSLMRILRGTRRNQQSQGRMTTRSTHWPQTPSVPRVRRSLF
jgi:hypothetical protein